jgi:hypothetical protein
VVDPFQKEVCTAAGAVKQWLVAPNPILMLKGTKVKPQSILPAESFAAMVVALA